MLSQRPSIHLPPWHSESFLVHLVLRFNLLIGPVVQMAAPHVHQHLIANNIPVNLFDAGGHALSDEFRVHRLLVPNFDTDCAACCACYLIEHRGYGYVQFLNDARVTYGQALEETSCIICGPRGPRGVNCLVYTQPDITVGTPIARPVLRSHSYQLYSTDGQGVALTSLAVGATLNARIEAIAVERIMTPLQLSGCTFSYKDAALLELERQARGAPSLVGTCRIKVDALSLLEDEDAEDENEGPIDRGVEAIAEELGSGLRI